MTEEKPSHDEKFKQELEEKRAAPLLKDVGLGRYQHIERLGNEEVEGLLDGDVIVETKIDGANLTVAYYKEHHGIVIASRNQIAYKEDMEKKGFQGAVEYVLNHDGIQTAVYMGWILRGEWVAKMHNILYNKEIFGHYYVFDVQDISGNYIHPDVWMPKLKELGVQFIPILARLTRPTPEQLAELTKGPDEFGAQQKEGIVIKRYDYYNKYGRMTWAKLVSKDFGEKNKLAFGASQQDPPELRFVANIITTGFIMKTIHTIEDLKGVEKIPIKTMPEVLGRVWHDAIMEELWDFIQKESLSKQIEVECDRHACPAPGHGVDALEPLKFKVRVNGFDFKAARRLSDEKTRTIALCYFNGIPILEISGQEYDATT